MRLIVTGVHIKVTGMPVFGFTHHDIQYIGRDGQRPEPVKLGLVAEKMIPPFARVSQVREPRSPQFGIRCNPVAFSKMVWVGMWGTDLDPLLANVRSNATSNPLVVVAALQDLKAMLKPYLDIA